MRLRGFLLANVVEETSVGDSRAGVVRMRAQEIFVAFDHRLEPAFDARVERCFFNIHLRDAALVAFLDPFVDFSLGSIVICHQFLIRLLHGIVCVHDGDPDSGLLLKEIAHRTGRIRRHQRAEQTDKQVVHGVKLARAERERKRRIIAVLAGASAERLPFLLLEADGAALGGQHEGTLHEVAVLGQEFNRLSFLHGGQFIL